MRSGGVGRSDSRPARRLDRDPDALPSGNLDDRGLVVFEPLALSAGNGFDPAVATARHEPQRLDVAEIERAVETRRDHDEIDAATRPLQAFGPCDLAKVAIEGSERKVPGLPGDLDEQAIGESKRRTRPEGLQGRRDDIGIL